ncbi:SpoIIE family protein phosphatase [Streptomyces sp. NPDC016675]|uniref:SpoIIE family protein phosphatase n=1 Tax=Streptomyces sp. NPDC016675 TaxID=3364970 RepID=UPI0036F760A9
MRQGLRLLLRTQQRRPRRRTRVHRHRHRRRLQPERRLLRWVSAGHPAPLLLRDGRVRVLSLTSAVPGLPLGVAPDADYTAVETIPAPGDIVLMYSTSSPTCPTGRPVRICSVSPVRFT